MMGVDQAFDGIGISFSIPSLAFQKKKMLDFLLRIIPLYDKRIQGFESELRQELSKVLINSGGVLKIKPGTRKKHISLALVTGNALCDSWEKKSSEMGFIVHILLKNDPTDEPEWQLASNIGDQIVHLAEEFHSLIPDDKKDNFKLFVESLALTGNTSSLAILPVLGGLYFTLWHKFNQSEVLRGKSFDMPIGRWKKALTGSGNAKKDEVKDMLYKLGFGYFAGDDTSDSIGILLAGLKEKQLSISLSRDRNGRILPTLGEREVTKEKKKAKKERKLQKKLKKESALGA